MHIGYNVFSQIVKFSVGSIVIKLKFGDAPLNLADIYFEVFNP